MSAASSKLRLGQDGAVTFWCPGCKDYHTIYTGTGPGARWGWNGNSDRPTFTPSVLVRSGHYAPGFSNNDNCWCKYNAEQGAKGEKPAPFKCGQCHTFITDGRIQFLGDCSHELAGQTVELPDLPHHE